MNNKVNNNLTFLVRLDVGWRKILIAHKKKTGESIKSVIEGALADYMGAGGAGILGGHE